MKYNMIILLLIISLIGCSSDNRYNSTNPIPQPTADISQSVQDAYNFLHETDVFASAAVGYAGSVSKQVKAFREILASEQAEQLFTSLQADAKIAGQLYGVCGLYVTNKEKFSDLLPLYKSNTDSVNTFFGCIMGKTEIAELANSFEDGSFPTAICGN